MAHTKVFISHSHADRDTAGMLDRLRAKHGAKTFLDQDQIDAGDALPARITDGIQSSQLFLLLWSRGASRSAWVQKELDWAYDHRKKIVPYRLDATPLPTVLENLLYIDSEDRNLGHASLLRAVFGKSFQPAERSEPFPGRWRVTVDPNGFDDPLTGQRFGMFLPQGGGYELELRRSGQVDGTFSLGRLDGVLGVLFSGGSNLWNMRGAVRGSWTYDADTRVLTLVLNAQLMQQTTRDVITIVVLERNPTSLQGQSTDGRRWIVERLE